MGDQRYRYEPAGGRRHFFRAWNLDGVKFAETIAWCKKEFGPEGDRWWGTGIERGDAWGHIYVDDPDDALHFRLRWC